MTRSKWYSPQLSHEIVSRLYFKAQAEGIPMTRLVNRLVEQALGSKDLTELGVVEKRSIQHAEKQR
jgi:hypothetical protein